MKRFLKILLCLTLLISLERFCHAKTQGFRAHKICSTLAYHPEWNVTALSPQEMEETRQLLSQPYTFLESGGECYVFISQDRKAVLKFFKQHHMREKSWLDPWIPSPFKERWITSRVHRLNRLFTSCTLAFNRFKEETGLIYLHLNKTVNELPTIKLFDAIGAIHTFPLDRMEFALQHTATLAYPTLVHLVHAKEAAAAEERLASLLDLIVKRCQCGLKDHDARKRNFGFVGNKAIELDLGSFSDDPSLKDPAVTQRTLLLETLKLHRWLKKQSPELSQFFEKKMEEHLSQNRL